MDRFHHSQTGFSDVSQCEWNEQSTWTQPRILSQWNRFFACFVHCMFEWWLFNEPLRSKWIHTFQYDVWSISQGIWALSVQHRRGAFLFHFNLQSALLTSQFSTVIWVFSSDLSSWAIPLTLIRQFFIFHLRATDIFHSRCICAKESTSIVEKDHIVCQYSDELQKATEERHGSAKPLPSIDKTC